MPGRTGAAAGSAFPVIVNPAGLDRHFAALANAATVEHHIVEVGDSRTYGEWYDAGAFATVRVDATGSIYSPAAILRGLFAATYGDPGEGFIFPVDDRVTSGGGILTGLYTGPSVLRNNRRFIGLATFTATTTNGSANLTGISSTTGLNVGTTVAGTGIPGGTTLLSVDTSASTAVMSANATASGTPTITPGPHTLALTIPSGKSLTRLKVIQGNGSMGTEGTVPGTGGSADVQITYTKNGGAPQNLTAPTNTGVALVTEIACTDGDVFVFTAPASGANTILGFALRTAQTHGVPVHRMGRPGYTSPNMYGGVFNGSLATPNGTSVLSAAQQAQNIRALYQWTGDSSPLIILRWGTNEVTKQDQAAGIDCGVTPGLFRATLNAVVKQVVADGGCVLIDSPTPSPAENTALGTAPLSSYAAMAYSVAMSNRHCAMIDQASRAEWHGGGFAGIDGGGTPYPVDDATKAAAVAAVAADGNRDPSSSHETPAGYQLVGQIQYAVLH